MVMPCSITSVVSAARECVALDRVRCVGQFDILVTCCKIASEARGGTAPAGPRSRMEFSLFRASICLDELCPWRSVRRVGGRGAAFAEQVDPLFRERHVKAGLCARPDLPHPRRFYVLDPIKSPGGNRSLPRSGRGLVALRAGESVGRGSANCGDQLADDLHDAVQRRLRRHQRRREAQRVAAGRRPVGCRRAGG